MQTNPNSFKKSFFRLLSGFLLFFVTTSMGLNSEDPNAIVGIWRTGDGNAVVRIYKNEQKYQGKIVWLKEPIDPVTGKSKLDKIINKITNLIK